MIAKTSSELIEQFGPAAFEAVHESDQDGLVYFAADGTIEYCNRAALRLFNVSESVVGANIFELAENDFEAMGAEILLPADHIDRARRSFVDGEPTRSEMIIIEGDARREVEVIWGPVLRDGEIAGVVGSYRDVSPRPDIHDQLAFEASKLEERRRFLASIIEVLDDGILVYNADLEVELANPAAAELLGIDPPVEGRDVAATLETSTVRAPGRLEEQLEKTRSRGTSNSGLHFLDQPGGGTRRLEVSTAPVGVGGERYICKLTDTTQRIEVRQMDLLGRIARLGTQAEGRADFAEKTTEAVVSKLDVDFAVFTQLEGNLLCPTAWRGILLQKQACADLEHQPKLASVLDDRQTRRFEDWLWADQPEGHNIHQVVIPLVASGQPLGTLHLGYTEDGVADHLFDSPLDELDVAFTDALGSYVSAALQNTLLLRETESDHQRLAAVLDTLPEGVILYNERGEVLLYNAAAVRITGYSEWSNLNTDAPPYRMLKPDGSTLSRSQWPMFQAVQTGEACHQEVILDFETHRRDVRLGASPVGQQEEAAVYAATLHDVTERRRVDRRKDEFLSIASHELRSPLTPLTGLLQLARRQREHGEAVDLTLLTRAERQINRLTRLIDGLLDLTRIETGRIDLHPRRVNLEPFVREAVQPWRINPKDIAIEVEGPDEPVAVKIDPDRITQVLTNVIDNAIKYSQSNGVIRIDVTGNGEEAALGIEDDGEGMDEETIDRIFDRFFHGPADGHGARSMGLGLYICRQIVEQHDGGITVESEPGRGTRVEVSLPIAD